MSVYLYPPAIHKFKYKETFENREICYFYAIQIVNKQT